MSRVASHCQIATLDQQDDQLKQDHSEPIDHGQPEADEQIPSAVMTEVKTWEEMVKENANDNLDTRSPIPLSKTLFYWFELHLGSEEDFEYFASQLPTWPFTQGEAEGFLAEYAHLSGPLLEILVKHHVLEQGKGGFYWMTSFGIGMRKLWAQMPYHLTEPPVSR